MHTARCQPTNDCRLRQFNALYTRYVSGGNPKPNRLLIAGDMNTDALRDTSNTENYFNRIFNSLDKPFSNVVPLKMAWQIDNPQEVTAFVFGRGDRSLDHVLSNFADGACSRGSFKQPISFTLGGLEYLDPDHDYTVCQLTGFDSAQLRANIQLWDSSDPNGDYFVWSGAKITLVKRGTAMTYPSYVRRGPGLHVLKGVPNGIVFTAQRLFEKGTEWG